MRILTGHRSFGQEETHPPSGRVQGGGRVALGGPALAEHGVGGLGRGAAQRHAEREQVPHERGDDLAARLLGGGDHDDARRPSPGDQVPQGLGQLGALVALAAPHVEGQLVDGHDMEAELTTRL